MNKWKRSNPLVPPAVTVQATSQTFYVVNQAANVRTGPGTEHAILDTVPRGTRIDANGITSNDWIRFRRLGQTAYISSKVLQTQPINQQPTPPRVTGRLCAGTGARLTNSDLFNRIVGTFLTGYNERGQWTEELARTGPDGDRPSHPALRPTHGNGPCDRVSHHPVSNWRVSPCGRWTEASKKFGMSSQGAATAIAASDTPQPVHPCSVFPDHHDSSQP